MENVPFVMGVPAGDRAQLEVEEEPYAGHPAAFGETATGSLPPETEGIRAKTLGELIAQEARPIPPRAVFHLAHALHILVEHASETYPHFESQRGQDDIKRAWEALDLVGDWR